MFSVIQSQSRLMKPYLVFCIQMTVLGLAGLISELGFNYMIFNLQTSFFVMLALQGSIGAYIARKNFDNIKYFVSWDEMNLITICQITKSLKTSGLPISGKLNGNHKKIRIELKNNEVKYFNFNYFYFPTRTTILEFFEGLKTEVGKL